MAVRARKPASTDTIHFCSTIENKKRHKLVHWDELEEWQRDNEFIHTGYLRATGSWRDVGSSLTFLHNETVNVYSHLIPGAIVLCVLVAWVAHRAIPWMWPFVVFGVGCSGCFALSATFHTLKCHSKTVYKIGIKLDYLGICFLVAASSIAVVAYAYDDMPHHFFFFAALSIGIGTICGGVTLMDRFMHPSWRVWRAALFVSYGMSGIAALVEGSRVWGLAEVRRRAGLDWLLLEGFMYLSGAFLYAFRIPEKWAPGKFDILGHSHQIFHCFVLGGASAHFIALLHAYGNALERGSTAIVG